MKNSTDKPITIHVYNKPVTLTAETIGATWQWFADNSKACAKAALAGEFHVNDLDKYVKDCEDEALRYENREGRMSLTFIQRALFIQTGESVPMLGN